MNNKDTLYIVSGYMRSGTSMMMRALEAGGMETVSRESREEFRRKFSDDKYDPNEGGLFELSQEDLKAADFPQKFKGKLIKCLVGGPLFKMCVMPQIKIIFMRRDPEEIRQSFQAFFNQSMFIPEKSFTDYMEKVVAVLRNRRDTEVVVLNYREVVENPVKYFAELKEQGWPIDPEKSALVVNPKLHRFRKENITPGII